MAIKEPVHDLKEISDLEEVEYEKIIIEDTSQFEEEKQYEMSS